MNPRIVRTVAVALGKGDGTFDPPTLVPIGAHVPSVDLGDPAATATST